MVYLLASSPAKERLRKVMFHLPFCISNKVLVRGIGKLVEDGEVFFIRDRKGSLITLLSRCLHMI